MTRKLVGNPDANKIVEAFAELGWVVEEHAKHVVLWNPANRLERLTVSRGLHHGYEHIKRMRSKLRRAKAALEASP
jgi:hypothetical protein